MRRALPFAALVATSAALLPSPTQAQAADQCWLRADRDGSATTPAMAMERPSPLGAVEVTMADAAAVFCYGAPSRRDREVWGGLVPLGEPWRMGANEATAIHMPFGGTIGGVAVEPGAYSLYMVPGESEVEVFVNSVVERWGIPITPQVRASDVGSFTRPVAATDGMVERLTFSWESHGDSMGHLVMEWENTRVEIPVHRGMM